MIFEEYTEGTEIIRKESWLECQEIVNETWNQYFYMYGIELWMTEFHGESRESWKNRNDGNSSGLRTLQRTLEWSDDDWKSLWQCYRHTYNTITQLLHPISSVSEQYVVLCSGCTACSAVDNVSLYSTTYQYRSLQNITKWLNIFFFFCMLLGPCLNSGARDAWSCTEVLEGVWTGLMTRGCGSGMEGTRALGGIEQWGFLNALVSLTLSIYSIGKWAFQRFGKRKEEQYHE